MPLSNKQIVEEINDAFDRSDDEAFLSYCAENITWNIIGDTNLTGKTAIRQFMNKMPAAPPQFTIREVVGDNNTVISYGDMQMKNKDGSAENYSFCDVYHFSNGKVAELITFMVKHKQENN